MEARWVEHERLIGPIPHHHACHHRVLVAVHAPGVGPAVYDGAEVATREHEQEHQGEQRVAPRRRDGSPKSCWGRVSPLPGRPVGDPGSDYKGRYWDHQPYRGRNTEEHQEGQSEGCG